MLTAVNVAAILEVGGLRIMHGAMSIGMLVAFQTLMASFLGPVNQLVQLGGLLQEAERLEAKLVADQRSMQRTLSRLAAVLQPRAAAVWSGGDDPTLLAACRLAGAAQGIVMSAPSGLAPSAIMFYRPLPERALGAREVLAFGLRGRWGDLLAVILLGALGGALGVGVPLVTATLLNSVIPAGDGGQLLLLVVALLLLAAAGALFEVTRGVATLRVEGKVDVVIQAAVWDRLLAMPVPFLRQYSARDLAVRGAGIDAIRQMLTGATVSAILGAIFGLFSFAVLFYFDVPLALAATALVAVLLGVTMLGSYRQIRQQRPLLELGGNISGLVLQLLTGIAKLQMTGSEGRDFARWAEQFSVQKALAFRVRRIGNQLNAFNAAAPLLTALVLFAVVAWHGASLSPGTFVAFYAAFAQFLVAMLAMNAAFVSVLNVIPVYERLKPILVTAPEARAERTDPGVLSGDIEINQVSFRYKADGPLALNDVSLRVRPGEFVAIVGPSGSGKSSLFRLLLGFETPEAGSVYYNGQDLTKLDVQAVRRQIGVVLQEARLMPGSIYQNIIGTLDLTLEDAWEAARMSGLDEDTRQMPMGMHTVITAGGATLSGGQRQRLMIARAVVAKPRLMLFDEATSALDNRTQETVSKNLEVLHTTRIVIAHRLSTIRRADRVYVLVGGRLAQSGAYAELLNQRGPFADLVKRQLA